MSDPYNQYTQYAPPAPAGQGNPPSGQYYMYNPSYQAQPPVTYQRGATESFGNAQGNMGYYGQPHQQGQHGEGAPADPNAPEGERGLGSALIGGAAGYYLGHKKNHGFLGAVGGALLGNFIGDKLKEHKHHHNGSSHSGSGHSSHGGSLWGGKW
ncbi:hypothetical protein M432DRAFT_588792 [Thermoascus aurantiacus ATCC 26904]